MTRGLLSSSTCKYKRIPPTLFNGLSSLSSLFYGDDQLSSHSICLVFRNTYKVLDTMRAPDITLSVKPRAPTSMVLPLEVSINQLFHDTLNVCIVKVNHQNRSGRVLIDLVANVISA